MNILKVVSPTMLLEHQRRRLLPQGVRELQGGEPKSHGTHHQEVGATLPQSR